MLPRRTTSTAQRKALMVSGALLLLGGWSLALAAPLAEPTAPHPLPNRIHAARAAMLNMALSALPVTKVPTSRLALDEPRPMRVSPRDLSLGAEDNRTAGDQPGPGFAIRWRESREIVNPDIVSLVRNYRRDGLPIVHLWGSNQSKLAIGLNSHGLPGIYFTSHVGG
jgi:hypothetical protein